ncbi:MAG: hypothetical protein V1689_01200 [Pseudomonadota bacterium]
MREVKGGAGWRRGRRMTREELLKLIEELQQRRKELYNLDVKKVQ